MEEFVRSVARADALKKCKLIYRRRAQRKFRRLAEVVWLYVVNYYDRGEKEGGAALDEVGLGWVGRRQGAGAGAGAVAGGRRGFE
jgi:hypothetical protein